MAAGRAGKRRFDRSKFKPKPQGEGRRAATAGRRRAPRSRENRPTARAAGRNKGGTQAESRPTRPKPREERPVRFDPDSPFAKLAALRTS